MGDMQKSVGANAALLVALGAVVIGVYGLATGSFFGMPTTSMVVLIGMGAFGVAAWLMLRRTLSDWPLPVFMAGRRFDHPFELRVTSSQGGCPKGLAVGNTVRVDREGALSRPLCVAVMPDVRNVLSALNGEYVEFACRCPVAGKGLGFRALEVAPAG